MDRKTHCDFPRSKALSQERLRSVRALHQTAAGGLGAAFSTLLRCPVDVNLAGVNQLPYEKYLDKLDRTSYFSLLRAEPLDDCLLLDVEPSILYPMIDRLLGGGREDDPPPRRPISDIELPLAARIVRIFLKQLSLAWRNEVDLKLEVIQVESNPRLLRALSLDEMVVSVDFQSTVGVQQGMMRLCIPCRAIQRLEARGSADAENAPPPIVRMPEEVAATDPDSAVEVSVTLASTSITAAELSSLQVGDIVGTEADANSLAVVSFSGEPKFLAKPGAHRGRKAVCITESVPERVTANDK